MKEIELNGKTIDEAKQAALDQLGVTEDLVEITIISIIIAALMGNTGFNTFVRTHFTKIKTKENSSGT